MNVKFETLAQFLKREYGMSMRDYNKLDEYEQEEIKEHYQSQYREEDDDYANY